MMDTNASTIVQVQTKKITVRGTTPNGSIPECRICLSPEQEDNKLISPCNCTGSVQYIHTKCFQSWISKKAEDPLLRQQILSKHGLNCQICNEPYQYTYEVTKKCANCHIFKKKILARKFLAFATLIFITIDCLLLGIMLAYAVADQKNPEYDIRQPRFFLVYLALTFAIFTTTYGFSTFGKLFLIYQSFELIPKSKMEKQRFKIIRGCSHQGTQINEIMQQSQMRMQHSVQIVQYV